MADKFRKKPVTIEAMQFTESTGRAIENWSKRKAIVSPVLEPTDENPSGVYIQIKTLEGWMVGHLGDWIIKGVKGEFYPCKPDIFVLTYEPDSCADPRIEAAENLAKALRAYREREWKRCGCALSNEADAALDAYEKAKATPRGAIDAAKWERNEA